MVSEHIARSYERKLHVPEGILGRKKKAMTIHVTKNVRKEATLLAEKDYLRALLEKHGISVDKNIEKAIEEPIYIYSLHHPDKNPYNKYETKIRVAAPTEEDAAKYTTLLQIISIPLAARTKSHTKPSVALEHAMWPAVDRRGDPKIIVRVKEEPNLEKKNEKTIYTYTGYPLLPFEEFKEKALERAAKNIYNELRDRLGKDISPVEFVEFVKKAADAAEKIVEEKKRRAGGTGFQPIDGDLEKIPEFVEAIRMIAKMMPEDYLGPPKKPTFPETKKIVEEPRRATKVKINLILAARELLGLLSGLKLAGYSENTLENLRRELERRIDGLIENPEENLELIGLYTAVMKLAEKGEIEKAEEFLRGL